MREVGYYTARPEGAEFEYEMVMSTDYEAAAEELDAQRLRADTAEAELAEKTRDAINLKIIVDAAKNTQEELRESRDSFQRVGIQMMEKLAAAEQRIAEMSELFKKFFEFVEMAPVSSGVCCCGCDTSQANHGDHMAVDQWDHSVGLWGREIDAALNPKPEAGSHEPSN